MSDNTALTLLREAFLIRQVGEHAPGGKENWRDWERKTEAYLRSLLPEPDETECTHPYVSWHGHNFDRGECQDCGAYVPPAPPEADDNVTPLFEAHDVPRLRSLPYAPAEPSPSAPPASKFTGMHTAGECGCGKTHDSTGALALNLVR